MQKSLHTGVNIQDRFGPKKKPETMGLQDRLDEYKKSFLEKAPAEAVEIMQRATEDLKYSGILDKVLKVGESAPEFSLPDENGADSPRTPGS